MSYIEAVALSAEVLDSKHFGDWQGTWYAIVRYQGTIQLVHGSYGSCSGCDAFESEFPYCREGCQEHRPDPEQDCRDCEAAMASYDSRLREFGLRYLRDAMTFHEAIKSREEEREWDEGADAIVAWLATMEKKWS